MKIPPLCSTGLRWIWLVVLVILLDLGSKQWIMAHFQLGESIPIIPFFKFTYTYNTGAAFSFLAGSGGWQRWFFSIIAFSVTLVLLLMLYRNTAQQRLSNCAYALIIAGALGNLFDRLVHGVVIDFIHFYIKEWSFPIFNLADIAICIGAALIILEGIVIPAKREEKNGATGDK